MQVNPYQSPTESQNAAPNPLLLPAIGCIILGILSIIPSLLILVEFGYLLGVDYISPNGIADDNVEIYRQAFTDAISGIAFALAAFVLARGMFIRKYKWLIVIGAVLGTLLIIPAPVTVLTLMRMRRKEIWDSFNRKS